MCGKSLLRAHSVTLSRRLVTYRPSGGKLRPSGGKLAVPRAVSDESACSFSFPLYLRIVQRANENPTQRKCDSAAV